MLWEPALSRRLVAAVVLMVLSAAPASAATTVFATSVFATSGNTANPGDGLGAADTLFARIGNASRAGEVIYSFADALSGASLQFTTVAGGGPAPTVFISIGEIIAGVAVYSAETSFAGGVGVFTFDFTARCALISAAGCSLVRVRTVGGALRLDGISGVGAAPEPAAWALMVMGFGAVAWRLKRQRRSKPAFTIA